jgi:Tfp pilus assembly protein PilZ
MRNEKRKDNRFDYSIRIGVTNADFMMEEFTKNISKGGMFLKATSPYPALGSDIKLTIHFPEGLGKVETIGRVVYIIGEEEAARRKLDPGIGIQFLVADDIKKLENLIFELSLTKAKRDIERFKKKDS